MNIEKISIDSLVFDPTNARLHSEKNLKAIKGSLKRFGLQKPIVIDKNNVIIAGNGTVAAAKELGWKEILAYRTPLEGDEAMAFALSDNRTAELASWDDSVLRESLAYLQLNDVDVSFLDFDLKDYIPEEITGSKELSQEEFSEFEHTCPKCGFEFDGKSNAKNGTME